MITDPWYRVVAELQHAITQYSYQFFEDSGLKTLHFPVTTGSISSPMGIGSDSTPVRVNICGQDTYLADSMQFMLEYGCRIFPRGCAYIMPSFRGEMADERHLCQFYHSEVEIPGKLADVMTLVERYIRYLSIHLLKELGEPIFRITQDLTHIEIINSNSHPFPQITLSSAIELLKGFDKKDLIKLHPHGFLSLTADGEQELIRHFGGFVWVTRFDALSVPFYQAYDPINPKNALNADLLFGIGEVVGSGERHDSQSDVLAALDHHRVPRSDYEWYTKMKAIYPLKTSGFGMGIERFILWILKHNDIRDCQILPRFNGIDIVP